MANMTLLQGTLPACVTLDGREYPIYTDFRRWIRLESILFEESGDFLSKIPQLLTLCYQSLPPTLEQAVGGMVSFYEGPQEEKTVRGFGRVQPVYSFVQDEMLIFAAFYQQYGIDLTEKTLHWWQFKALLHGLSEETQLARVMSYRAIEPSQIKDPEQKRFYRRMKELYRLRDTRSEQEQEKAVIQVLEELF